MIVRFLNIGQPKSELLNAREYTTGINKLPVSGPLDLEFTDFSGDGIGDRKDHGDTGKAVCVYNLNHYKYWTGLLGIELPNTAFGENLTITNIHKEIIHIGNILIWNPLLYKSASRASIVKCLPLVLVEMI